MARGGVIPLPELDLFSSPPIQQAIERDVITEYKSITPLNSGSLSFVVHNAIDEYVKLNESDLYIKLKIWLKKDSSDIDADPGDWNAICPVNNFFHSLFSEIKILINNEEVTRDTQRYPYRAYLETLLGYSQSAKNSHLSTILWKKDNHRMMEGINAARVIKPALGKPYVSVELMGKLFTDLTHQCRAIIGGATLKFDLLTMDSNFYFMSQNPEKLHIKVELEDASFYIHKAKVTPNIVNAHRVALHRHPAIYPITHVEVKSNTILGGTLDFTDDNIVIGQLPRQIILGLVSNAAANGSLKHNPFNFKHYNTNSVCIFVNGIQFPAKAYTPNWNNNVYLREYLGFMENMNADGTFTNIDITREEYASGFTLFAFNLSPDLSDGCAGIGHISAGATGSMRVQLKFASPLPEVVNVIYYLEYDNSIMIDENGHSLMDHNRWTQAE